MDETDGDVKFLNLDNAHLLFPIENAILHFMFVECLFYEKTSPTFIPLL